MCGLRIHVPLARTGHLESRTRDEAAKSLGWSLRTLDRRLARGRELLKARLVRRGVGTLGLGISVLGGDGITAAIPDRLIASVCGDGTTASVRSLIVPKVNWEERRALDYFGFIRGGLFDGSKSCNERGRIAKKYIYLTRLKQFFHRIYHRIEDDFLLM